MPKKKKEKEEAAPAIGNASPDVVQLVHEVFMDEMQRMKVDLTGFNSQASLVERIAWALGMGMAIGAVLSRFSQKLQHSTTAQATECVTFGARAMIYVPPEYVCVDEGMSGRKRRRDGLERITAILKAKAVKALLVYKVSRLFRVGYRGFQFFQEEVVDEGLRGISVSQGIDTRDEKTWKHLMYLHGMMDEMLIGTIGDHVRAGLKELASQGYVTGALTVGYDRVPVPGAPLTNQGKPRCVPAPNPVFSERLNRHVR